MYLAFATTTFKTRFAYRTQIWAQLLGVSVSVFAKVAIWIAVFGTLPSQDGITLKNMITYAIIGSAVGYVWEWEKLLNTVGNQIRTGDVTALLLKPMHYLPMLFFAECGNLAFKFLAVELPVLLVIALIYGVEPPASVFDGLMFPLFCALSFVIFFLIALIAGLAAFWLMTVFSLEWFLRGMFTIMSGAFIPLWFFPDGVAAVLQYLPFAWITFHPMSVYLGKTPPDQVWLLLVIGLVWAGLLALTATAIWHKAASRLIVQGG